MRTHQGVHGRADKQHSRDKLIEEFLLDDGPFLSLGAQLPPTRMHKQAAKLRTVSIIDTLSELTPGELDQEDLYGTFHSFFPGPHTPHTSLHCRSNLPAFHTVSRRIPGGDTFARNSRLGEVNRKVLRKYETISTLRPSNPHTIQPRREGSIGSLPYSVADAAYGRDQPLKFRQNSNTDCPYLSDTGLPCRRSVVKPLQRNLLSMSSTPEHNLVSANSGQKSRWQSTSLRTAQESTRHCFSDSEIDTTELLNIHCQGTPQGVVSKLKYKSAHSLDVDTTTASVPRTSKDRKVESWICSLGEPCPLPSNPEAGKSSTLLPSRYCRQSRIPEWIRLIFKIAKQGNLEMLKAGMKDMDSALVRNLSDCNGNNLWHVCSARNYLPCVQWLSNKFGHEALKDENKSALTPCILAVKNGSLSVVQWLLEHTSCQVFSPTEGSRSLLHYAAKYGQGPVFSWLVEYMTKLNMDLNAKDAEGNTALHLASKYGHIQCVKDVVLHGGDLMSRNELGLRPYDLAVFSQQSSCAEYLISVESCLALATDHYLLEGDAQRYRTENSDAKRNFKDLLQLMKSGLRHQREMLDACKRIQSHWRQEHDTEESQQGEETLGESSTWHGSLPGEEFERWFSSLILKDESLCQMIEDKWKRQSRKAARNTGPKREPLDILRSQFVQTQVKANSLTSLPDVSILSSSESDCSEESGDESTSSPQKFSSREKQFPDVSGHSRELSLLDSTPTFSSKNVKLSRAAKVSSIRGRRKGRTNEAQPIVRPWSLHVPTHPDMDLRDLFERNPELKQEGQTCSVLEVLEPSSSENEELAQLEKQYGGSVKASKSSNSLESESSCLSGCKSKTRSNQDVCVLSKGQVDISCCGKVASSTEQPKAVVKSAQISKVKEKNKESGKRSESKSVVDSVAVRSNKSSSSTSASSDSKSLDSERIEADAITLHSSSGEGIETSSPESSPELATVGQSSVLKKKRFLLKFSLKNRWTSKQKQRNTKKSSDSISDDIKDSKIDAISIAEMPPSSQLDPISDNLEVGLPEETVAEIHNANLQQPKKVERFLPPPPPPTTRRDPPPMPPTDTKEYTVSVVDQLDCTSTLLPDILSSMTLEETPTEHSSQTEQSGQSSNEQFCSSSDVSRLYCSTAKSDSRPPSSASRIDSTLRPEDGFKNIGFPLRKTSSASTELLVTPDSSTAGRQSPAPSEVSKTESALSPPSDISKTESQRHASHLGKIEETSVIGKKSVEVKTAAILDIEMGLGPEGAEGQCMEVATYIQADVQVTQNFIQSKASTKKESSNKPWYEVSDDEDILSPGRSLGTQSNSEDEVHELVR